MADAKEYIEDSVITAKVKAELVADKTTKARDISVETNKGIVSLSGTVDSPHEAERALDIARDVKGVIEVRNKLTVKVRKTA
ncbi:MAG TPA: BON domain-containing protein [Nitrospirota bacterium]|jgi:osmotically-inducible protein OsmY